MPPAPLPGGWQTVELELPDSLAEDGMPVRAAAEVIVPAATARFGIISGIDDTVLWTNVTNTLNMALMLARSNAHTGKPLKGVAAFYRALHEGLGGNEGNSVFYVSGSRGICSGRWSNSSGYRAFRSARCCCANWACAKCSS